MSILIFVCLAVSAVAHFVAIMVFITEWDAKNVKKLFYPETFEEAVPGVLYAIFMPLFWFILKAAQRRFDRKREEREFDEQYQ